MITREQFGLWKHEPITKLFFDYLRKKEEFLKTAATEQWLAGSGWPETVRGQIIELQEVCDLPFEAIEEFLRETGPNEGN